ncbi:GGDEF domain-containing protein [uncultured Oxalicibacterium sp.]|uniref:GGDEF domain-containing protein n=1 Tax=uncultured Oxalicibacterium sp. TaxID=1168540 RepID=UPI0025FF9AAE|nr:GGDEF domain-containing protein [uncultured Oxalicibacterium sp.]
MTDSDLFADEVAALASANALVCRNDATDAEYRVALELLSKNYERLMRETRRLIARSDRTELELNLLNSRLHQLSVELEHKATHDNLTGVLNRGAIFERAAYFLKDMPIALVVLDIDFFKRINDEFGHPVGDAVLKEVVVRLNDTLGEFGEVGRVGGEEFTILLPHMEPEEALNVAEGARSAIANHPFASIPLQVSASFGVSWGQQGSDFEDIYGLADAALYQAKRTGRNRVEIAPGCITPLNVSTGWTGNSAIPAN